jgi:arylsulfatase A-like enzyme/tetratricopeptide (TPR) repeat protein
MKRIAVPAVSLLLVLTACTSSKKPGAAAPGGAGSNLLLITVDTLRPDRLSCYSPKHLTTPAIDGLAARGALFERAFSHAPLTLPSHANILLGATSPAHGVVDNGLTVVPREFPNLAKTLKAAGYATGAFVSAFPLDTRFGLNEGFDIYDDKYPARAAGALDYPERRAEKTVAAAVDWLGARTGKWFLWIHVFDPHAPYAPPEPYASRFAADPYSGEVAYVDAELGKLLAAVDARGETGRTVVVLTADHGESLGEHGEMTHGYFAYNSTLWVPLVVAGPSVGAARVRDFVGHVDIFPTACDLLGLAVPPGLSGRSLRPLLEGRSLAPRPIYFEALEASLHRGAAPVRGLIDGGRKYFDSPIPELYDLAADFDETSDLAPRTDLGPLKKALDRKIAAEGGLPGARAVRRTDRETAERLRSLGYVAGPAVTAGKSYGPADDLKTLLPFEQRMLRANQLAAAGRSDESARLLEEIVKDRPDYSRAYARLAELRFAGGRVDLYLDAFARGVRANPGDFTTVSAYGIALVEQHQYDRGIEVLGRALALFDADPNVWGALAEAYWKKGDLDRALEHFESALALAPGDAILNGNLGNFYVDRGLRTKNAEDVKRSFAYFETALATDPTLASVHNGLGGARRIAGDTAGAIASWEKAVELDPKYDLPVYNLAVACLETGNKARALAYARTYLTLKGGALTAEERRDVESLIEKCR